MLLLRAREFMQWTGRDPIIREANIGCNGSNTRGRVLLQSGLWVVRCLVHSNTGKLAASSILTAIIYGGEWGR